VKNDQNSRCYRRNSLQLLDFKRDSSVVREGLQIPLEVAMKDEKFIVVKGHRRHACLQYLAGQGTPGFSLAMKIPVVVVEGASDEDLMLRSVLDNAVREDFTPVQRIRIAKKFHTHGVSAERAASSLGVNKKTYERDLLLANHDWMFEQFIANNISATHATQLLEAAQKANRLVPLKEDFEKWVGAQKLCIAKKEAQKRAKTGKGLSSAKVQVKSYLTAPLLGQWLVWLREGRSFEEVPAWSFSAGVDTEFMKLHIAPLNLDLGKTPLDSLIKLVGQLNKTIRDVLPIIRNRHCVECPEGAQAGADEGEEVYDMSIFEEEGMADVVRDVTPELIDDTEALDDQAGDEDPSVA
jgi:ParB-like chromosome segregation protein Spo0J